MAKRWSPFTFIERPLLGVGAANDALVRPNLPPDVSYLGNGGQQVLRTYNRVQPSFYIANYPTAYESLFGRGNTPGYSADLTPLLDKKGNAT